MNRSEAPSITLRVWGDYACFTRPELKVERISYPMLTPSAARGILDAILWKPQMRWHVRRITALEPWWLTASPRRMEAARTARLLAVRRNEIQGTISPRTIATWMSGQAEIEPYLVDSAGRESAGGQNRTQRNSLLLRDVAYLVHASPLLTSRANQPRLQPTAEDEPVGPDSVAKYVAMFQRRVAKGQCFHRPYLGCREFACQFGPADGSERPLRWTEDLGWMLYDLQFGPKNQNHAGFFRAQVREGVLHCDTRDPGPLGETPAQVLGWDEAFAQELTS